MATPTTDKLRIYYPSKYLGSDGAALPQFTADSGGTVSAIVDAALTEADDYWNGAIGWFDGDTASAALRGVFFHVKDFDAATDTLVLAGVLPAAPAAGDTYRLVLGGNYRSAKELPGLLAGGELPEEVTVTGTNITGLTIKKVSPKLGAGTLSVFYDQSVGELFIKVDAEAYGVGLDVSSDVTDGIVFDEDGHGWVQVDVVAASLPGSDQTDTWTISYPLGTLTPDYEGYETRNEVGGKTRYRLEVIKNTDTVDNMVDLAAYTGRPAGNASDIAAAESLGTDAGSVAVNSAAGWPTSGFWVKNITANSGSGDCRFVKNRSGNTINCAAVDWAELSFGSGSVQINPGDLVVGASSGAAAVVDQVVVASGSWGGSDAAGTLLLKNVTGTFTGSENLQVSSVTCAVASGNSALGLRGFTATSWAAGDTIELMGDIDIGGESPSSNQFGSPADEVTAPAGVTFQDAPNYTLAMQVGTLAPGAMHGIWRREWIMDPHAAREGIDADTHYAWS